MTVNYLSPRKMNNKIKLFINVLLCLIILVLLFLNNEHKEDKSYLEKRITEYEFLIYSLNNANFDLAALKDKWGEKLNCNSKICGNNWCCISSDNIISDQFFAERKYFEVRTDFYGFAFLHDEMII